MQIKTSYAHPVNFSVDVNIEDGFISYNVKVSETELEITYSYADTRTGVTKAQINAGADFIRESLKNRTLHLPTFIPIADIADVDQWDGVAEQVYPE
jgi:hypothetical protein